MDKFTQDTKNNLYRVKLGWKRVTQLNFHRVIHTFCLLRCYSEHRSTFFLNWNPIFLVFIHTLHTVILSRNSFCSVFMKRTYEFFLFKPMHSRLSSPPFASVQQPAKMWRLSCISLGKYYFLLALLSDEARAHFVKGRWSSVTVTVFGVQCL